MTVTLDLATPRGLARVDIDEPVLPAKLLLILGHGAGGGVDSADLLAVRDAALGIGAVVARVRQPYRVAGHRTPPPAAHLDAAWVSTAGQLRDRYPGLPLVAGGRSSGGRVACRTAPATGAVAVLALAFPLRPEGHPERSRAAELVAAGVPVLVVNGDRDPFGVPTPSSAVTVHVVAGANHSLRKDAARVATAVAAWLTAVRTPGKQSARPGVGTGSPVRPEDE